MAVRYYDDAMVAKLKRWIPDASRLRVLKPDESTRLMQLQADDSGDKNSRRPFGLVVFHHSYSLVTKFVFVGKAPPKEG